MSEQELKMGFGVSTDRPSPLPQCPQPHQDANLPQQPGEAVCQHCQQRQASQADEILQLKKRLDELEAWRESISQASNKARRNAA